MTKIKQLALEIMQAESAGVAYPLLHELINALCELARFDLNPPVFLDNNATYTIHGKAVSPIVAARCAEDIERSRVFMRGIFQAISERVNEGKKVTLLYAGTGPFALLVLPALAHFNPSQLQITLLDIHRASLDCVEKIIDHLDAASIITAIECGDASTWTPPPQQQFDIVLSETMKHLLQQEPQVAVFSHLQQFLKTDGVLIPEEISLQAWLSKHPPSLTQNSETLFLGEFFKLNQNTAKHLQEGDNTPLSTQLQIPPEVYKFPHLKLTTDIRVYQEHVLTENQSQLTLPRYFNNANISPGTSLACNYRRGSEPDWDFNYKSSCEIDFARIAINVPLSAMLEELRILLAEDWIAHVNQRDYRGGWDALPLRCQSKHLDAHPVLQSFAVEHGEDWEYLPIMQGCPTILGFLNSLPCNLKAVRLMRLKAGAEIRAHRDAGLGLTHGEVRLHLPLHINKDVDFFCKERRVPMRAGELWYFNADKTHSVHNRSDEDRISLVMDCSANAWLRASIDAHAENQAA